MTSPAEFIQSHKSQHPQFASFWDNAEKFIEKKLWFQLTQEIQTIFSSNALREANTAKKLTYEAIFTDMIQPLYQFIDPYIYVTFALQVCSSSSNDQQIEFLQSLKESIDIDEFDAHLLLNATLAYYYVLQDNVFTALDLLVEVESKIDSSTQIVNNLTHFQLHKAYAMVERTRLHHLQEFHHKIRMLSYSSTSSANTDSSSMFISTFTRDEQVTIAKEICISALLSESIYNLGDILTHAVIQKHSPENIKALLKIFQQGDLTAFESFNLSSIDELSTQQSFLLRKLQVISLINHVFAKPATQRSFSFGDLSVVVHAKDELDLMHIVIYSFGVGVLRGSINGVDQLVSFTWVQPRLLDRNQLSSLRDAIDVSITHTNDVIGTVLSAVQQNVETSTALGV